VEVNGPLNIDLLVINVLNFLRIMKCHVNNCIADPSQQQMLSSSLLLASLVSQNHLGNLLSMIQAVIWSCSCSDFADSTMSFSDRVRSELAEA
jgi:hypothetical protein